ncbi:MAG: hypothetical protein J5635_01745 [Paludibacteraceae bacterium]|nr:hypothetical protein [Paludibacteraceae bacterium]
MKKLLAAILLAGLFALPLLTRADDYIDDAYYTPEVVLTTTDTRDMPQQPYYDKKNMEEIIFLNDTTEAHPDTVKAIIRR